MIYMRNLASIVEHFLERSTDKHAEAQKRAKQELPKWMAKASALEADVLATMAHWLNKVVFDLTWAHKELEEITNTTLTGDQLDKIAALLTKGHNHG